MYEVKNSAEGRVFRCRSIRLTQVASTGTMNTYPSHASMLVSGLPKHAIIRYYSPRTAGSPRLCSRLSTQWSLTATMQVLVLPKCDYTGIRYLPRISAQAAYVGKGQTVSGRRSGERLPTKCIRLYIRSEEAPMTSRCRRHRCAGCTLRLYSRMIRCELKTLGEWRRELSIWLAYVVHIQDGTQEVSFMILRRHRSIQTSIS